MCFDINKRIEYLESEIQAGGRHDGWVLKGLKTELKLLLAKLKQIKES